MIPDSPNGADRSQGAERSSGAEERVDEIVADYLDRINAGEMLDRHEILREHPEHAAEVVERLDVFQTLGVAAECDSPPLGTLGDYTLRRQIGRGGMDFLPFWKKNLGAVTPSSRGVVRAFVLFARGEAFASPRVRR